MKTEQQKTTVLAGLKELLNASTDLGSALVSRNTESIMAAVVHQESLMSHLRTEIRTPQTDGDAQDQPAPAVSSLAEEVENLVSRIRRVQATNRALAGAFLSVVNRTLQSLGKTRDAGVYSRNGDVEAQTGPVLVLQQG